MTTRALPAVRPSWADYFFAIARVVAKRATCPRAQVGAVIIDPVEKRILSTGYNGAPPGQPHCSDAGCLMENGHCGRAIHAELNAIGFAARYGVRLSGSILVVYYRKGDGGAEYKGPCAACSQAMVSAGVTLAGVRTFG